MRTVVRIALVLSLAGIFALTSAPVRSQTDGEVAELRADLNEAQALLLLGVSNKGAGLSLEEGLELAVAAREKASGLQADTTLSAAQITRLQREAGALVEELNVLVELYEERFFGVYPLARLVVPTLLSGEGFQLTEQLFHPPDLAAVELAGRALASKLESFEHPNVILLSQPYNPRLETVAYDVLLRSGTVLPHGRSNLLQILTPEDLAALDRGDRDPERLERVMQALNTEVLAVIELRRASPEGYELTKYLMSGGMYLRGEAVQGSALEASPTLRALTVSGIGSVIDRRGVFRLILVIESVLLLLAMAWAGSINWGMKQPLRRSTRLALGAGLFLFGRAFVVFLIIGLQRFMPEPSAMASSSLWWPAAVGFGTVLIPGILAWLGQAWLTDMVPGARGARAVGTLFGTTALGAASYFATPALLMIGTGGVWLMVPLVLAVLGNAVLFAYAARFGPPVPTGFICGPLVLTPMIGVVLLQAEPTRLWWLVGATAMLLAAATLRHRRAVVKGVETHEQDHAAAAKHEKEKLDKLRQKLKR